MTDAAIVSTARTGQAQSWTGARKGAAGLFEVA